MQKISSCFSHSDHKLRIENWQSICGIIVTVNHVGGVEQMTITLDIPKTLEKELNHEAAQIGLSLPEYILQLLSLRPTIKVHLKTGTDLVTYWQEAGLIGTRTDISDSLHHARQIRAQAEKRAQDNSSK